MSKRKSHDKRLDEDEDDEDEDDIEVGPDER